METLQTVNGQPSASPIPTLEPFDAHNTELQSHVRPPDWQNPTPQGRYNLVVIGAGTAGLVTAAGAAGLGAKVALIERALMGGDCLNVGCVPSKALIRAGRAVSDCRSAAEFGVQLDGPVQADFSAVMERMRRLRAGIAPNDSVARFQSLGIDVYYGQASLTPNNTIQVEDRELSYSRAVIATGARASAPPIAGLDEVGYLTNETVFSLTELPARLVVIGGGPIGCELAQCFARFGSRVTLIEAGPQILGLEDKTAAELVANSLRVDGVNVLTNVMTSRVTMTEGAKQLTLSSADSETTIECDEILVGVGRAPNVGGLNLEGGDVDYDEREGIHVNDRLVTSNSRIFAAGDVCSRYKFTHAADAMARIVIQNSLFFGRAKLSRQIIPWCTYTDPEVAHVGKYANELDKDGIPYGTIHVDLAEVDRAVLDGESNGFLKVHYAQKNDQILGATLVARHAGDMISEIGLAMTNGLGLRSIAKTIHPYPTQTEVIKKAADAFNRTRLTPFAKRLFTMFLAWRL